jgi:hypothetical protein
MVLAPSGLSKANARTPRWFRLSSEKNVIENISCYTYNAVPPKSGPK